MASIPPKNSKGKVLCELHFDKQHFSHAGRRPFFRKNTVFRSDRHLCSVQTSKVAQTVQIIDDVFQELVDIKRNRKDEECYGNIDLKCDEHLSLSDESTEEVYLLSK